MRNNHFNASPIFPALFYRTPCQDTQRTLQFRHWVKSLSFDSNLFRRAIVLRFANIQCRPRLKTQMKGTANQLQFIQFRHQWNVDVFFLHVDKSYTRWILGFSCSRFHDIFRLSPIFCKFTLQLLRITERIFLHLFNC